MYDFLPLGEQYDRGFGAMGDAFHESAQHLSSVPLFLNQHLVVGFLLRHSVELYLKSIILVLHRRLKVRWAVPGTDDNPRIEINKQSTPLFSTHSVLGLYGYVETLFLTHSNELAACTRTDWAGAFTADTSNDIRIVDAADAKSGFFRYPMSGNALHDAAKSAFKRVSVLDISQSTHSSGFEPIKAFITYDDNDDVVASYAMDRDAVASVRQALQSTAEQLSTLHFAVRMELAGRT